MSALNTKVSDLTFIHLTDLHLLEAEDAQFNRQYPARKLRCVLERVRAMEITPAFWLISGDLVNNGQPEEYQVERVPGAEQIR